LKFSTGLGDYLNKNHSGVGRSASDKLFRASSKKKRQEAAFESGKLAYFFCFSGLFHRQQGARPRTESALVVLEALLKKKVEEAAFEPVVKTHICDRLERELFLVAPRKSNQAAALWLLK
jgi:hypothetical protein